MTRAERNSAYRKAGAPGLQDTEPEPLPGLSASGWRLTIAFIAVAALVYVAAVLWMKGM